jgi:kynurenine formamidase
MTTICTRTGALALAMTIVLATAIAQEKPWFPSRWGPGDQRGAANRMTPEKLLEAIHLIREGKVYQLGRAYEKGMPTGSRTYDIRIPVPLGPAGKNKAFAYSEYVCADLGQVGTQLDGLGHFGSDPYFYNGFDRHEIAKPLGLEKLGIENVGVFFARGILIDVAGYKGLTRLDKGYEITTEDLKEALQREGNIRIHPGDVVLLHTGWGDLWMKDNTLFLSGEPGIGAVAAQFLVDQEITLVGSDTWATERFPLADPEISFPVHQILLTKNGIYNLENLDTTELARDRVYEFAFIFAPLKLKGATGSPGNPIAIR